MKIAVYQMEDRGTAEENLKKAYEEIVKSKADFFVLPEFFVLPGGDFKKSFSLQESYLETGEPGREMLQRASRTFPGYIIGGTVIEETSAGYFNTCYVYKQGEQKAKYRKIKITQEEIDRGLLPGEEIVAFPTCWGKVGLMVCADSINEEMRDLVGKISDVVFLPVSMTDPHHPKVEGHPLSAKMSEKHGVVVVKVSRVGIYDGLPVVSRSAILSPSGVLYEASEEGEELAEVTIPGF